MSHCNVRLPRWYHWISFAGHAWKDKATEKPTTKSYCWELGTCTANFYVHHEPWNLGAIEQEKQAFTNLLQRSPKRNVFLEVCALWPWPRTAFALQIIAKLCCVLSVCFTQQVHTTWIPIWYEIHIKNEKWRLVHEQVIFVVQGIARYNRFLWATLMITLWL